MARYSFGSPVRGTLRFPRAQSASSLDDYTELEKERARERHRYRIQIESGEKVDFRFSLARPIFRFASGDPKESGRKSTP